MPPCISVDPGALWAGLKEALVDSLGILIFMGGLVGVAGWKRPTRMAWLHNRMLLGGFVAAVGPTSVAFVLVEISDAITFLEAPGCHYYGLRFLLGDLGSTLVPILLTLVGTYVLVLRQAAPFLVERTGKRVVDEVIERYRRPGERVVVARPRLVVDGAGYYQAVYLRGEGEDAQGEPLLVREDGQVVRDEALARRILLLGSVALDLGEPGQMAQRYELYRRMKALTKGLRRMLAEAPGLRPTLKRLEYGDEDPLWLWQGYPGMVADFERLVGAAEIFLGGVERIARDLEVLSEMSWRKGGPKMEELRWEEWEALEGRLEAMRYWNEHPERMEAVEGSVEAVERMRRWIEENDGADVVSLEKWGKALVRWVETWAAMLAANEEVKRRGGREKDFRWFGVSEKDMALWRRRLARVRKVEGRHTEAQEGRRRRTSG